MARPRLRIFNALPLLLLCFACGDDANVSPPSPPPVTLHAVRPLRATVSPSVEIAPWVLDLREDRVVFSWVTREASIGTITTTGDSGEVQAAEGSPTKVHRLELPGLHEGTHYDYLIDGRFRGSFETAREGAAFRFCVFGHPGGTHAPAGYPFAALCDRLVGLDPAFAICTGDLCYTTTEESFEELYFDVFQTFLASRPIYAVPGNHEAGFPTSEGIDYGLFRRLFPYEFGAEDYAYHSFVRGNVEFFACAYGPARKGTFAAQLDWLKEELRSSKAEFRVVLFGGAQEPMGFDRGAFFQALKQGGADFVFGGDGSGTSVTKVDGVDFFFAGTQNQRAHDFFMVQTEPYRLEITQYDVPMSKLKGDWLFETKRPKNAVLDAREFGRKGRAEGAALYGPLSLPADSFHGVRLRVHNPLQVPAALWLRWAPTTLVRSEGDYHYREEARRLAPLETATFHYALPSANPRTGEAWTLGELEVRLGEVQLPNDFDMTKFVLELTAFVDPLAGAMEPPATPLDEADLSAPR